MSAENNIRVTDKTGYSRWSTGYNSENGVQGQHTGMSADEAREGLNLFRRSIHNAKVLDGNVILSDGKLMRVSYGSYHGLFAAGAKTRAATGEENQTVRAFLRTVLTTYVEGLEGLDPAKKAELKSLIDTQLSEANETKPLMRRTIRLLVDAVDGKTPQEKLNEVPLRRELQGSWNAPGWKQVGDDDLGVKMTKGQFKSMLTDGLKVAKRTVEVEDGADAATVSDRKKALDRLVEHYLKLFDEGKTDGCLGAFVGTGMDPESLGAEMLEQLNRRAFAEKLQGLALAQPSEDGKVFGVQDLAKRATEIRNGKNHVRSLLQRNVVTFGPEMDWSAKLDGRKQKGLAS